MKKSYRNFARIVFLNTSYGNSCGDVAWVLEETEGEVYYEDGFGRYCYMNKSEEGLNYLYVKKGDKLPRNPIAS